MTSVESPRPAEPSGHHRTRLQKEGVAALIALDSRGGRSERERIQDSSVEPLKRRGRHSRSSVQTRSPHLSHHAARIALVIAFSSLFIVGALHIGLDWAQLRYLIYATWMIPLAEFCLLAIGHLNYRFRFQEASDLFTKLIIQVTTTGKERDRVNQIIDQIHSYCLEMDYEVWVVTEPAPNIHYPHADKILVVPQDFRCRSARKARALEYSRRARKMQGLHRPDVKILFNDDDVTLTKAYIKKAFVANYDICEGVIAPRTEYSVWPLNHFVASHADDIRTHACLVYCSVFQGLLKKPLHVHGEGLVVTGETEDVVTWDWPAFASEDLVFGQRAAQAGFVWGWFHEYVEVTSPWTIRDFITQRRRWLWGDLYGVQHRAVLTVPGAMIVLAKYSVGIVALVFSVGGIYLRVTGRIPSSFGLYDLAKVSLLSWVAIFFSCGWVGAGSEFSRRNVDARLFSSLMAVLAAPVTIVLTFAGILIPFVQGDPRTFAVIRKTRKRAS